MFSGLNRYFKYILPKRLFYRALIIVAAPTIILQLIITIVFYDSIWIKANKNITRSLVVQLKTIQEVYENDKKNLDFFTDIYKNNFNFEIGISQDLLPRTSGERKFSPMDRSLRRELKSAFGNNNYWFNTSKFKNAVKIKIKSNDEVIDFLVPKEMISTSSVRLFVLWTTLPSILLIIIALIFLKNQTKPLVKLAKAAERFGKGDYVNDFRASGSLEIRKAAFEFDRMAKRINRHLNQRAEMLSGISHDLRTPLTRLKLQLAMIQQKELSEKMSKDIDEMEKMLNDYLQFAKTQAQENTSKIDIVMLFNSIKNNFSNEKLTISNKDEIELEGRPIALKRSFENIIQNGLTYGNKVSIDLQKGNNRVLIIIEDDGPGIPEDQYKNVFKPFLRLDKSRSLI
jgi:two-component system osmolarity sensor histidine kinase EnvZ